MSLIKCDKCGELFSDSYRECPFCAEDEEYYNGNVRKGNRRGTPGEKRRGILVPVLILAVVLLAVGSGWYFFGDQIKSNIVRDPVKPAAEDVDKEKDPGQEAAPPVVLTMDSTLRIEPEQSETIQISGGTGYEWSSSDPAVAIVSKDGTVTAVSEGTAIITATDTSGQSAVCSVTVAEKVDEPAPVDKPEDGTANKPTKPTDGSTTNKPTKPTGSSTTGTGTGSGKVDVSKLKISIPDYGMELPATAEGSYDMTMEKSKGETSVKLVVEGVSGNIVWSSDNEGKVTATGGKTEDGKLKVTLNAVGTGEATITGKVGSATITFLVRVR